VIKYPTSLCLLYIFYPVVTGYSPDYCMLYRNVKDFVLPIKTYVVNGCTNLQIYLHNENDAKCTCNRKQTPTSRFFSNSPFSHPAVWSV